MGSLWGKTWTWRSESDGIGLTQQRWSVRFMLAELRSSACSAWGQLVYKFLQGSAANQATSHVCTILHPVQDGLSGPNLFRKRSKTWIAGKPVRCILNDLFSSPFLRPGGNGHGGTMRHLDGQHRFQLSVLRWLLWLPLWSSCVDVQHDVKWCEWIVDQNGSTEKRHDDARPF